MSVVLDSELISDVLMLPLSEEKNINVIRNMLILLQVMLFSNNEKAIEQMRCFDIIKMLMNIITGCPEISYLALGTLGILVK